MVTPCCRAPVVQLGEVVREGGAEAERVLQRSVLLSGSCNNAVQAFNCNFYFQGDCSWLDRVPVTLHKVMFS